VTIWPRWLRSPQTWLWICRGLVGAGLAFPQNLRAIVMPGRSR